MEDEAHLDPREVKREILNKLDETECLLSFESGNEQSSKPEIEDIRSIRHGKNTVYEIVTSETELIAKFATRVPSHVLESEAAIIESVHDKTEIPVPEIFLMEKTPGVTDAAYLLMQKARGTDYKDNRENLSEETSNQICFEAGKNLAQLHETFSFERFGSYELTFDSSSKTRGDKLSETSEDKFEFVPDNEFESWNDLFRTITFQAIDELEGTRFSRWIPKLTEFFEENIPRVLKDDYEPVLIHGDYRHGNILVEPEKQPVTTSVLDWGQPIAAHDEYELAITESILINRYRRTKERHEELRRHLYRGYAEFSDLRIDDEFRQRRELYRVMGRVRLMKNLEVDLGPEATETDVNYLGVKLRGFQRSLPQYTIAVGLIRCGVSTTRSRPSSELKSSEFGLPFYYLYSEPLDSSLRITPPHLGTRWDCFCC